MNQTKERVVLIGEGATRDLEDALVRLAKILDFEVVVMDHSPMIGAQPDQLFAAPDYDIASFKFLESDSAIVLTHSERDADVLQTLSGFKLRYVGLLGDRQRIRDDTGALRARGVDEKFVSSIKGPVGADIGARTMPEIALSIMAKVVATKYGKPVIRKDLRPADDQLQVENRLQPGSSD